MINYNLAQIFSLKGIPKPTTWLRKKAGLSHSVAQRLMKNKVRSLTLDTIEKICFQLHCTPNDLLTWSPDNKVEDIAGHPLQQLRPAPVPNMSERLKKMNKAQILKLNEMMDDLEGVE